MVFNELFSFSRYYCSSLDDLKRRHKDLHIHNYESDEYNFNKKSIQIFIDFDTSMNFIKSTYKKYLHNDLPSFNDIYMNLEDCKKLISKGFQIGAHSKTHRWMEFLDDETVFNEVLSDCYFIDSLNISRDYYCYPYGSYSNSCIEIIKKAGFKFSFTIESGDFNASSYNPYLIRRHDANDFFAKI